MQYVRKVVYIIALFLAFSIYVQTVSTTPEGSLQEIRLQQYYGLVALFFLYVSLLISPINVVFPNIPGKVLIHKLRKPIGVSAFFFALLHGYIGFFYLLGGFDGISFLSGRYLLAILLSFSALLILSVLAITSLLWFKQKMGSYWKVLHRFVYLAGILILLHVAMIGTHFADTSQFLPQVVFFMLFVLFALDALRIDIYLAGHSTVYAKRRLLYKFLMIIVVVSIYYLIAIQGGLTLLHFHSE